MNNLILSILILFISFNLFAQKERALVRKGNKHYNNEDYVEAEVKYKKAIEVASSGWLKSILDLSYPVAKL